MHPDYLTQQVAPLILQQVAPFFRTQTTTDRQTSLLVESDGHVLGELHAAYPRVRRHRTRRPRETLAWRGTAARSDGTLLHFLAAAPPTNHKHNLTSLFSNRRWQCCGLEPLNTQSLRNSAENQHTSGHLFPIVSSPSNKGTHKNEI